MGALKTIIVVILIAIAIFFGIRMLTPEDSWICENGSWARHGNPNTPMPTAICSSTNSDTK